MSARTPNMSRKNKNVTLDSFLYNHTVEKNCTYTHLRMRDGGGGGRYFIPIEEIDEFMSLYSDEINRGTELSLIENTQYACTQPLLIDFDFRQREATRLYSDNDIKDFVSEYLSVVYEYFDVNPVTKIYICKRPEITCKGGIYYDGLHILIPDICASTDTKSLMRLKALELLDSAFQKFNFVNTTDNIFDVSVIETNGWFLYGSSKPNCTPYKVDIIYNLDLEVIPEVPEDYIIRFGVRTRNPSSKLKEEKLPEIREFVNQKNSKIFEFETSQITETPESVDLDKVKKALGAIKMSRCDDYHSWIKIGIILKSVNLDISVWKEWSKQSYKYEKGCCDKVWKDLEPRGNLSLGSLYFWAKEDHPDFDKLPAFSFIDTNKVLGSEKNSTINQITTATIDFQQNGIRHIKYSDKWVRVFVNFLHSHKHIVIKSDMGTGKTTRIRECILTLKPKSILIITPREIFGYSMYGEIVKIVPDLKMYKDIGKAQRKTFANMVCQLESLHTIKDKYDLVIVDESESILKQFSSSTMEERTKEKNGKIGEIRFDLVYPKFEKIINNAKNVIWADAFVQDRTLMTARRFTDEEILFVENTYQPYARKAIKIGKNKNEFIGNTLRIIKSKPKDKNIIISSSKDVAKRLELLLPNAIAFHSDADDSLKVKMKDVNDLWKDYDNVIYTSSITVGVNYDRLDRPFDNLFIFFNVCCGCIRDYFQASLRARNITSNTLYFADYKRYTCQGNTRKNFDVMKREKLLDILNFREHWSVTGSAFSNTKLSIWLKWLWVYNRQEDNVSTFKHEDVLYRYLDMCGYTIENETEVGLGIEDIELTQQELTVLVNAGLELYDEIKDVPSHVVNDIMERVQYGKASMEEKLQARKFYFNTLLKDHHTIRPEVKRILFSHYSKNTENIKQKIRNCQIERQTFLKKDNISVFCDNYEQKYRKITELTSTLKLEGTYELNKVVDRETLGKCVEEIFTERDLLTKIFSLRVQGKKKQSEFTQGLDILNQIFTSWGFTELKVDNTNSRRRKKVNGKLVYWDNYIVSPMISRDKDNHTAVDAEGTEFNIGLGAFLTFGNFLGEKVHMQERVVLKPFSFIL
jgi:hypothetical protein